LIDCWWGVLDLDTARTMGFRYAPIPEPNPEERVPRPAGTGFYWRFEPLPPPSTKLHTFPVYISRNEPGELYVRYAEWIQDKPVDASHMARGNYAPMPDPPPFCRLGWRGFDARYLLEHGLKYACPRCQVQGVLVKDLVDQQYFSCPRCSHHWHTQRLDGNRLTNCHTLE